jgi:hypothetical protein
VLIFANAALDEVLRDRNAAIAALHLMAAAAFLREIEVA